MRSEQTYNFEAGPYCLCCGSREVMTLDVYIAQSADWEAQSRLKDQRLWLSFSDLDEHELDAFVADVSAAVWFCHAYVPVSELTYAAFRSNAKGLLPPSDECLRLGL
jgi:hypothetical protein